MAWYMILLYIFAGILGLGCFIWVLGRLFRPKIKYKPSTMVQTPVKEEIKEEIEKPMSGLSLDNKLSLDEDSVEESQEDEEPIHFNENEYSNFRRRLAQKHNKKTLLEQIQELSPELKMLIFDKGLARKDFEIMSKKD